MRNTKTSYIIDGKTGILIEPRNTDKLISAIEKIISNKDFATQMAICGNKFVKENFSKQKFVDNITKIYESILNV